MINKLRELFVVRRGGGKTPLVPGKGYVLTKQGALKQLDENSTESFDQYAEDPNALLMLGDRGDLRQLETIQRNLSVLFNNMIDANELYDITPDALSPQIAVGARWDAGGVAFCPKIRIKGAAGLKVSFEVMASNDGESWEQLSGAVTHEFAGTDWEVVGMPADRPKYQFFKLVQGGTDAPEAGYNSGPIAGIIYVLKNKAVPKFFLKRASGELESAVAKSYDMSLYYPGAPVDGQKLYKFIAPETLWVRENFEGFQVSLDVMPSAPYTISVTHNDVEIGTLTVGTTGALTVSNVARTTIEPGDRIAFISGAPSGAADLSVTISFERTPPV